MKRLAALAAFLFTVTAWGAASDDGPLTSFYSGTTYRALPTLAQATYLLGQLDAIYLINSDVDGPKPDVFQKCTEGWTGGQTVEIMNKFLDDHPEAWHLAASVLFSSAVIKACKDSGHPLQ